MDNLGHELSIFMHSQVKMFELLHKAAESEGADKTAKLLEELAISHRAMYAIFRMQRFGGKQLAAAEVLNIMSPILGRPVWEDPVYENHTREKGGD